MKLFAAFLILSGCSLLSPQPEPKKFDAQWEVIHVEGKGPMACLPKDDLFELREILIRRCEADNEQ